jgi:preprotein translocase subunit SecG
MFGFLVAIHIIASLLLITIILMQSGRGGGLTETFAGAESIFGTKTSSFLVKSTTVLAVIFLFTSISLALLSTQRSRSLIENEFRTQQKQAQSKSQLPKQDFPVGTENKEVSVTTQVPVKTVAPKTAETAVNKDVKQIEQTNQKNIVPGQNSQQTK